MNTKVCQILSQPNMKPKNTQGLLTRSNKKIQPSKIRDWSSNYNNSKSKPSNDSNVNARALKVINSPYKA